MSRVGSPFRVTIQDASGPDSQLTGEQIPIRGLVQGVGFRPAVWRMARDLGLRGDVRNDGEGVLVHAWGGLGAIAAARAARRQAPA